MFGGTNKCSDHYQASSNVHNCTFSLLLSCGRLWKMQCRGVPVDTLGSCQTYT
jgi:hypothetical protein